MRNARTHRNSTDRKLVLKKTNSYKTVSIIDRLVYVCLWECVDGNQIRRLKNKYWHFFGTSERKKQEQKKIFGKNSALPFFVVVVVVLLWPTTTTYHFSPLFLPRSLSLSRIFKRFLKWAAENRSSRFSHECVFFFFSLTSLCLCIWFDCCIILLCVFYSLSHLCVCVSVFSLFSFYISLFRALFACLSVCVFVC